MSFGKEVKKIRLKRNRTQKFMALQLGFSTYTYWRIENDKIPASSDHLYSLLDSSLFTKEEQLILSEKYQERVDEEWTEEDDRRIEREIQAAERKKRKLTKEEREQAEIERRIEYRKRKNITYLTKEVKKPKPDRERIKRAVPKSYAQRLF